VGQACSLRRPRRPAGAGPRVLLRGVCQSSPHRIVLDVPLNAAEFLAIAHQVIVALVLPERLPGPVQQQISSSCSGGFERAQQLGSGDVGCE